MSDFKPGPLLTSLAPGAWTALGLGVITFIALFVKYLRARSTNLHGLPYPPGPRGFPFVGNAFQIPLEQAEVVYKEWQNKYGNVIYLEAMGQPILIANSVEDSVALLEAKSSATSGRPRTPSLDILDQDWNLAMMPYGSSWRVHRRAFHQSVKGSQLHKYRPIIEEEMFVCMQRMERRPEAFLTLIRQMLGHAIMRVTYGAKDFRYNEQLILAGEEQVDLVSACVTAGTFLVDFLPLLKHLPMWLPGMRWKKWLTEGSTRGKAMARQPFEDAKKRLSLEKPDTAYPSIVEDLVRQLPPDSDPTHADQERIAVNTAANVYFGGSSTTAASLDAFFMAMAMFPEVQREAQRQLDDLLDVEGRLPTYNDLHKLPYLQALVKEVSRWHTTIPLAGARASTEDVVHNGWFIPKGTLIRSNTWAIMHDPVLFEDPFRFNPKRFLKNGRLHVYTHDPESFAFGHGRRICPGRDLAKDTIAIVAMSVLSVFDIVPCPGKLLKHEWTDGLVAKIHPFELRIVPRSERHAQFLRPT